MLVGDNGLAGSKEPFHNNTANTAYPVSAPALPAGATATNAACLSAQGNVGTGVLHSCPTNADLQGSGALRFTNLTTFLEGGVFAAASVPTSQGLDVTFNAYQYSSSGTGSQADGMAFVLAAVDPGQKRGASSGRGSRMQHNDRADQQGGGPPGGWHPVLAHQGEPQETEWVMVAV